MSKIFFIFVIVAFVYCTEVQNAEFGQYPGLDQAMSRLGFMPGMEQMRNLMNPEYWKQQAQNGQMVMVNSNSPANGKPSSDVTILTKQDGKLTEQKYTN